MADHTSHHPRRRRKNSDAFFNLSVTSAQNRTVSLSPQQSSGKGAEEEEPVSLTTRYILSPFRFITFILSLALVDWRDRAYRFSQHSTGRKWVSFSWLHPEPYQDPSDSTWKTGNAGAMGNGEVPGVARTWSWRKKHRKMMRLQMTEAFEGSTSVAMTMGLVMLFVFIGLVWAVKMVLGW